jgi:sugar diacid utilization regulator
VVSDEHRREAAKRPTSVAARRRECVKRLLAGELVDHSELGYDLEAHHLAIVAKGEQGEETMRGLAGRLERNLLAVRREEEPVWACWLGGRSRLAAERAIEALAAEVAPGTCIVLGEPGEGLAGWRFSHRQAKAALPVAERSGRAVLRYADVAMLASMLGDDLLATSLRRLYLEPLERARDGGEVARQTLHAYFAAERNVSSTAAALGVDRRTVTNRMRAIEALLGRSLRDSATDLEIALRLDA